MTKNSKYIEVHYHFIHEYYLKEIIHVVKIETNKNIADIFTKALDNIKFIKFRNVALTVVTIKIESIICVNTNEWKGVEKFICIMM